MNECWLLIGALCILSGFSPGIIASRNDVVAFPSELIGPCSQTRNGLKGYGSLLRYYEWLRSASDEKRRDEYECAYSIAGEGLPDGKLLLALVLTIPDAPYTDFSHAKALLDAYLDSSGNEESENRDLARILLALLDEIERLEKQLEQLKEIENDITDTEKSVNVPSREPTPNHE